MYAECLRGGLNVHIKPTMRPTWGLTIVFLQASASEHHASMPQPDAELCETGLGQDVSLLRRQLARIPEKRDTGEAEPPFGEVWLHCDSTDGQLLDALPGGYVTMMRCILSESKKRLTFDDILIFGPILFANDPRQGCSPPLCLTRSGLRRKGRYRYYIVLAGDGAGIYLDWADYDSFVNPFVGEEETHPAPVEHDSPYHSTPGGSPFKATDVKDVKAGPSVCNQGKKKVAAMEQLHYLISSHGRRYMFSDKDKAEAKYIDGLCDGEPMIIATRSIDEAMAWLTAARQRESEIRHREWQICVEKYSTQYWGGETDGERIERQWGERWELEKLVECTIPWETRSRLWAAKARWEEKKDREQEKQAQYQQEIMETVLGMSEVFWYINGILGQSHTSSVCAVLRRAVDKN
ncbi:hypothetical protein C8J56DRAFT_881643 [Mycena floridula]|nr:hypothetical protein C8J56DRAFT_881643 [Mycena floridula]